MGPRRRRHGGLSTSTAGAARDTSRAPGEPTAREPSPRPPAFAARACGDRRCRRVVRAAPTPPRNRSRRGDQQCRGGGRDVQGAGDRVEQRLRVVEVGHRGAGGKRQQQHERSRQPALPGRRLSTHTCVRIGRPRPQPPAWAAASAAGLRQTTTSCQSLIARPWTLTSSSQRDHRRSTYPPPWKASP